MAKRKRRPVRERQYKHVMSSLLKQGRPFAEAVRIAAATVNKERAALSRGKRVCKRRRRGRKTCRVRRGPKLIGRGGSRRQWYPGKRRTMKRRRRAA